MTLLLVLLGAALALSLGALVMTLLNLRRYRPAPGADEGPAPHAAHDTATPIPPSALTPHVDVCVPARDEAGNLEACVRALLASTRVSVRVLVYDDQSRDDTPRILAALAAADPRVAPVPTRPLPEGWNGKQHACWRMAEWARANPPTTFPHAPHAPHAPHDKSHAPAALPARSYLAFIDADVRAQPALLPGAVASAERSRASLVSTFPRQITESLSERLVVPLIHFVLFSYLPMGRMQRTLSPAASAACGQFILVEPGAYFAAGGHEAFKASMHDGVQMPRALRRAGHRTDLFDGTDLVSVRMYRGAREVWRGFTKNAYEGLGSLGLLIFITLLHAVGHVLPWAVLLGTGVDYLARLSSGAFTTLDEFDRGAGVSRLVALAGACVAVHVLQRAILARRFRQSWAGVCLHPLTLVLLAAIQWWSLVLHLRGRRTWRGRTQG